MVIFLFVLSVIVATSFAALRLQAFFSLVGGLVIYLCHMKQGLGYADRFGQQFCSTVIIDVDA
jgi:hypothetical protein